MVAGLGRARDTGLGIVVERALAADWRAHDWRGIFGAEDIDAHVDLADVDQAPRPELEFQEALAVGAKRHFVVDARRHVAEMRRRDVLPADGSRSKTLMASFGDLMRWSDWRGPHISGSGTIDLGSKVSAKARSATRGHERACGEILQEPAAVRGGIVFR